MGWRNKHRLNDDFVKEKYYFLYMGYKQKYYYWDLAVVARRSLLVIINVIFQAGGAAQLHSLMIILILVTSAILHMQFYPYENLDANENTDNTLNQAEAFSLASSFIVFFMAQFLFVEGQEYSQQASMVIIIILSLFFGFFGWKVARSWALEFLKGKHLMNPEGRHSMSEDRESRSGRKSVSLSK